MVFDVQRNQQVMCSKVPHHTLPVNPCLYLVWGMLARAKPEYTQNAHRQYDSLFGLQLCSANVKLKYQHALCVRM